MRERLTTIHLRHCVRVALAWFATGALSCVAPQQPAANGLPPTSLSRSTIQSASLQDSFNAASRPSQGIDNNGIDIRPATPVDTAAAVVEYPNWGDSHGADPFETSDYKFTNSRPKYMLEVRYQLANGDSAKVEIAHQEVATLRYTVGKANLLTKGLFLSVKPPAGEAGPRQRVNARHGYNPDLGKIAPVSRTRRRSGVIELVLNVHGFETVVELRFKPTYPEM